MSEWGNPVRVMAHHLSAEYIGRKKPTQGTETSKYLEEKKSTETPRVVASESGLAQTDWVTGRGCGAARWD